MACIQCGQEIPAGAKYCPRCTGGSTTRKIELRHAATKGAALGLGLGMALVTGMLVKYELEPVIATIALLLPLATLVAGLIIGLLKAKREWK
jgi:hypothetical protein